MSNETSADQNDPEKSVDELIQNALNAQYFEEYWNVVEKLHLIGNKEVFRKIKV